MFRLSSCLILIVVLFSCGFFSCIDPGPSLSLKKARWAANEAFYDEAGLVMTANYNFEHPLLNITLVWYDPDTRIGFIYVAGRWSRDQLSQDQLDAIDELYETGEAFILYIPPIPIRNKSSLEVADAVAQVYMEVVDFIEKLRADGHL